MFFFYVSVHHVSQPFRVLGTWKGRRDRLDSKWWSSQCQVQNWGFPSGPTVWFRVRSILGALGIPLGPKIRFRCSSEEHRSGDIPWIILDRLWSDWSWQEIWGPRSKTTLQEPVYSQILAALNCDCESVMRCVCNSVEFGMFQYTFLKGQQTSAFSNSRRNKNQNA